MTSRLIILCVLYCCFIVLCGVSTSAIGQQPRKPAQKVTIEDLRTITVSVLDEEGWKDPLYIKQSGDILYYRLPPPLLNRVSNQVIQSLLLPLVFEEAIKRSSVFSNGQFWKPHFDQIDSFVLRHLEDLALLDTGRIDKEQFDKRQNLYEAESASAIKSAMDDYAKQNGAKKAEEGLASSDRFKEQSSEVRYFQVTAHTKPVGGSVRYITTFEYLVRSLYGRQEILSSWTEMKRLPMSNHSHAAMVGTYFFDVRWSDTSRYRSGKINISANETFEFAPEVIEEKPKSD